MAVAKRFGRRLAILGGLVLALGVLFLVGKDLLVGARPNYPLASKGPPDKWNTMFSFPEMTLADLLPTAHSVVLVQVREVEERWEWQSSEYSQYRADVLRYIVNRSGQAQTSISIVQPGGGREVFGNMPHLQPGRSYVLLLFSGEGGGRQNANQICHPAGILPLVAEDVVETWSPHLPWENRQSPFRNLDDVIRQILALTGG